MKEEATIEAAFDGHHGWFWRNRSGEPLTITLQTDGPYIPTNIEPDIAAYIVRNDDMLPSSDLTRSTVHRVVIGVEKVTIQVSVQKLCQVIEQSLKVQIPGEVASLSIKQLTIC